MSKLDVLRKIIREEVRGVIREELSHLLKETVSKPPVIKNINAPISLKEQLSTGISSKINKSSDPIMDLLNETKMNMTNDDYRTIINADASMAQGFGQYSMSTNVPVVENVNQMLATSRPAADITHVQIDAVPDFSALMKTMKTKGQI
jgi:hypothetical protein